MGLKNKCYPKARMNNVLDITSSFLAENNIKGLIIDVDNTLMDYDGNILNGIEKWVNDLQQEGIKICILTNTKTKQDAEKLSKMLNDIPYVFFAMKPLKFGFKRAKKMLKIDKNENIAVVGDQIMTDILRSKQKSYVFNISKTSWKK